MLFFGFAHLNGEIIKIVVREVICNGRWCCFVIGMGGDAVIVFDSAHVYLVVGPVFIRHIYLGAFGFGYCRLPL